MHHRGSRSARNRRSVPGPIPQGPSLCPQLLLGDQALHEFGSFLLIGLNALVQEHFAHLRNRPLLVFSDPLDVLP